jgi:hypothetical protein
MSESGFWIWIRGDRSGSLDLDKSRKNPDQEKIQINPGLDPGLDSGFF